MHTRLPAADTPIVINWHVTEACNYHCQFCYAKWEQPEQRELIRDPENTEVLLFKLFEHFSRNTSDRRPRLNFAGGEPLLHATRIVRAMEIAHSIGFDISLISNGSRLDSSLTIAMAPFLSMLGLSVDAVTSSVNTAIGRVDRRGVQVDLNVLATHVALARQINPSLTLKVNTVVNGANWREDMRAVIGTLAPARWKVLRMLPVITHDLAITGEQFQVFVDRHSGMGKVMCIEDNDDMVGSYIMVDPHGRFFQNRANGGGYDYSSPILEVGTATAFDEISWSAAKFASRYPSIHIGAVA